MRRFLYGLLGFFGGLVFGWCASMALYMALTTTGALFDRDGGLAMGFAFTIGPIIGLIAGMAGAILMARKS